eukprot:3266618-Pyramimonas_sp.AAC.1
MAKWIREPCQGSLEAAQASALSKETRHLTPEIVNKRICEHNANKIPRSHHISDVDETDMTIKCTKCGESRSMKNHRTFFSGLCTT